MSTQKDNFSTIVTDYFINHVSTHLSSWLQENHNVEVTPEDICGAFSVPYAPKTPSHGYPAAASVGTQMPNIPGYFQNTGAAPAKKTRKKTTKADPNGPKCIYVFQRGKANKKGTTCGQPVDGGGDPGSDQYCKQCLKKKTVQKIIYGGDGDKKTVQPTNLPGGMVEVPETTTEDSTTTINAVPIEGRPNVYYDQDNGFVLEQLDDGSLVALAMRERDGTERPLTTDEKQTAQLLGMSLISTPKSSPAPAPAPVPVPANNNAIGTIPQVPVPQIP